MVKLWPLAPCGGMLPLTIVTVTLGADHRATDGHKGGLFLEALNRNLQEVEKL